MDAYEVGYTGVVAKGRAIDLGGVLREQASTNDILFTEDDQRSLHRDESAAGLAAPAVHVIALVPGAGCPAQFTYLNFGQTTQKGLELGVNVRQPLRRRVRELLVPGDARRRTSIFE